MLPSVTYPEGEQAEIASHQLYGAGPVSFQFIPFEYQSPTVALFIGVIKLTNDGDKLGLFIQRDIQETAPAGFIQTVCLASTSDFSVFLPA